ncbi:hypothetical protein WOLCODRAFT_139124 [Wolfiporia cocos MD-104 SS10]|uniref:Uncharacterized protein n=1 Tax=Wolfiporia cocos (strain MD-104) TaxID=742152 RepID=A0A2H3JRU0_WOLCO|nr:hypothetical protein WOLCODRAFT_139124 [Wolfiporia cocos MD-104 SS10]
MATFSWSDSLQAVFSSCLYCLRSSDDHNDLANNAQNTPRSRNPLSHTAPPPRARPDELEGLLADSDSADAETLSLHSNIGDERRRRRRKRTHKGIRIFGIDLFGRPPIHLDSDDEQEPARPINGRAARRARALSSSSTLDSDASPLDPSTIDEAAIARLAAATAAAEEEQRRAKEERRRLRRERKELKRMAMAMGIHAHGDEEFEGFPGSGSGRAYAGTEAMRLPGVPPSEEFGPFAQAQPGAVLGDDDDADVDGADFGAEPYTHRAPVSGSAGDRFSDSRSRTSATNSTSNADSPRHSYHPSQPHDPLLSQKSRSARSKSVSSKKSASQSTASQSASLPSPPPDATVFPQAEIAGALSANAEEPFEGFPGGTLDLAREHANVAVESTKSVNVDFPSVGLRGIQRTKSDMGVFLANRGEA